jgi:hypothetical protein
MEGIVLVLVCLSPWAFGSTETFFEFLLDVGVALVLALWGARLILEGQLTWKHCPVVLCLGALFLLGTWQLVPLSRPVLTTLSPATARLYDDLLPTQTETLPAGEAREVAAGPVGSTLSVYPTATRAELLRLLAVVLLFAAVRNNIASPAALRRLSFVALVNGSLLALFGLVQYFSSPHGTLFWTYPTDGDVFGPFLNRNHFAWYINLCVGLSLGLLRRPGQGDAGAGKKRRPADEGGARLDRAGEAATGSLGETASRSRRRRRRKRSSDPVQYRPAAGDGRRSWSVRGLLDDPRKLWVLLPITLMVCGAIVSQSRGAVVAAGVAGLVCLLIKAFRGRRLVRLGSALVVPLVLGSALLLWFGLDRVTARFATLGEGNALQASRLSIWTTTVPLVQDYAGWGTGLGTYTYVESLHRTDPLEAGVVYEHAHNEYLELLIESGAAGLVLGLLAAGLILRLAFRAARRAGSPSTRALALGTLFALVATVAHAVVEFGLHIPAIALLVTVIAAQVADLGSADGAEESSGGRPGLFTLRLWGLAPLAGAVTALVLGLILCGASLKAHLVQRLLAAAAQARQDEEDPERLQRAVAYLEDAVALAPEYAQLQCELGQAHLEVIEAAGQEAQATAQVSGAVQATVLPALLSDGTPLAQAARAALPTDVLAGLVVGSFQDRDGKLSREHLGPGLRHCLLARDLCPLLARPQVRLADYAHRLAAGDARGAYLRRAKTLVPFDPEIWYFSGLQELLDGRTDEAWQSWHHSLELSGQRLPDIVHHAAPLLTPAEILDRLLPDKPDLLYQAAFELYPDPEATDPDGLEPLDRRPDAWAARLMLACASASVCVPAPLDPALALVQDYQPAREREPFLVKALALLDAPPGPTEAKDFHLKAQVQWALWQLDAADASYRKALARQGLNPDWHYEYARLLYQEGRRKDARRELFIDMALPSHPWRAGKLLEVVTRERALREDILK